VLWGSLGLIRCEPAEDSAGVVPKGLVCWALPVIFVGGFVCCAPAIGDTSNMARCGTGAIGALYSSRQSLLGHTPLSPAHVPPVVPCTACNTAHAEGSERYRPAHASEAVVVS
jgi:hypothetical protein